jgi:hypothetical protein
MNTDHLRFAELELSKDLRWQALCFGLEQLTDDQLARVVHHARCGTQLLYDTFNYDPISKLWCPLAVGLDVSNLVALYDDPSRMTNDRAKHFIVEVGQQTTRGFTLNPLSGVPGNVFRTQRRRDLLMACGAVRVRRAKQSGRIHLRLATDEQSAA